MEKKRLIIVGAHMGIGSSSVTSSMIERIDKRVRFVPEVIHVDLETGSLSDLVKEELLRTQTKVFELQRMATVDDQYFNPKFTNRSARRKEEKQIRKNNKKK